MIYNIIAICISCICTFFVVTKLEKEEFNKKNKILVIEMFVFLFGFFVRTIGIQYFPIGLNTDEASSGYEAYAISNYGIDRNGNFLPVFLVSWGSGQNALYSYLIIPFVKVLGLNIISTRLPMAIIGCISLVIWYLLLRDIKDKKFALIGLAFLCICPWHIMKSRWGLESNVFPDIVLWAVYLLMRYLKTKEKSQLFISSVILGISGYAYGTAYFFLPIFCLIVFVYLLYKKEISIKDVFICLGIIFIIALPIMLCVLINTFDLTQINLPFLTIPKMPINRYEEQTILFSGNVILNSFRNIKKSILLIFLQNDELSWNSIKGIGMYYVISIPFIVMGIIFSFKNSRLKKDKYNIINIWFVSAFLLLLVLDDANINRINIIIFPVIYYIINGLEILVQYDNKIVNMTLITLYIINFVIFANAYIKIEESQSEVFINNMSEVIEYVDALDVDKVYFQYDIKEPYIYVLYYTKYNPHKFINTVQYFPENKEFDRVKSFGKYNFYLPDDFGEKNCAYVINKDNDLQLDYEEFHVKEFEKYLVLEKR